MYVYMYVHVMEYYSAIKKNELMPFEATWIDVEMVTLSELSQTEKEKYGMISHMPKNALTTVQLHSSHTLAK